MISLLNLEPLDYSKNAADILKDFCLINNGPMNRKKLINEINLYEILIVRLSHQIDKEIINAGKKLKVICSATTGLNHIDIDHAYKKNISILSLKGEYKFLDKIHATAEHTWALIMSLKRKINEASISVTLDKWERDSFKGSELNGSTIGIVGYGRIGKKIANYAKSFGMNVLVYDKYEVFDSRVIQEKSLSNLLSKSDIVSIHVPLNEKTFNMFSIKQFQKMKKNSILVNTSRGEIINENDLIESLEKKYFYGAALDVIQNEVGFKNHGNSAIVEYAKKNNRLLITPHIGGATYESMEKTEVYMANKIKDFLKMNLI